MKPADRIQGLIDYLNESKDTDGRCNLGDDEVEAIIEDLSILKLEIKNG